MFFVAYPPVEVVIVPPRNKAPGRNYHCSGHPAKEN